MRIILFSFFIPFLFSGCSQTLKTPSENIVAYSERYEAPDFTDSARFEKLKGAFTSVNRIYKQQAEKDHFPAIVYGVVFDGKLVHAGATGILNTKSKPQASTKSLFRIASMTKSFTAMAILKLRDEGKIDLTVPASKYIPEMGSFRYPTKDSAPITIQNLLTMTAGFPEDNPWGDRQLEDTDDELKDFLKSGVSFSNVPGSQFEYSNLGYAILGNIITRVTGKPYQQYITEQILKPLGMNDTEWEYSGISEDKLAIGYRWEDEQWKEEPMLHDGAYGAMGGLITSIEDFSKYVALHLSAWPPSGESDSGPLKRNSIREMHRPFLPRLISDAKRRDGTVCPFIGGYGYGLGYRQDCKGDVRIAHSGGLPGFGSEFSFYPDYGIGVISFANRTYAGTGGLNARVLDTLMTISGIKPRELPASEILHKRKGQLIKLLTTWDEKLGQEILAENFYLDQSRDSWIKISGEVFAKTGKIISSEPVVAENQLRGYFHLNGEKNKVQIYFTLSPELDPKIQQLELNLPEDK